MDERIAALDSDVATVKIDVALNWSKYLTKEDLNKAMRAMTWKIISLMTVQTGAVFYIARYVH